MVKGQAGAACLTGGAQKTFGHLPFFGGRHGAEPLRLEGVQWLECHDENIVHRGSATGKIVPVAAAFFGAEVFAEKEGVMPVTKSFLTIRFPW
jgi:hypothetical protein